MVVADMYGKQILQQLQNNTTIPFAHYAWSKAPEQSATVTAYGILAENKINKLSLDNTSKEEALEIDINVYLYTDELDERKFEVETVLDNLELAYSFSAEFSAEVKLIHLIWKLSGIYGGDS